MAIILGFDITRTLSPATAFMAIHSKVSEYDGINETTDECKTSIKNRWRFAKTRN